MSSKTRIFGKNKEEKENMIAEMNKKIEESKKAEPKEDENVVVEEIKPDVKPNEGVQIAPPWITFANEILSMFNADSDVHVDYNDEEKTIRMFVDNQIKADALSKIMPTEKDFGNVSLKIEIYPSNVEQSKENLYKCAFMNNPNVAFVKTKEMAGFKRTYVVFEKYIAQFPNDDLCDYYGNKTALLQDLARDIFEPDAEVCFCTDIDHTKENAEG